jgi:hypothetical protein
VCNFKITQTESTQKIFKKSWTAWISTNPDLIPDVLRNIRIDAGYKEFIKISNEDKA